MLLGENGKWMWLTAPDLSPNDVLKRCPQLVIDRFVLITSKDNKPRALTEDCQKIGWQAREKYVLSPRIGSIDQLSAQFFDEWYIFLAPAEPAINENFVSHEGFRLTKGHMGLFEMKADEQEVRFWEQLSAVRPHAFIAANENLFFCTDDGDLYESVAIAIQDSQWALEAT